MVLKPSVTALFVSTYFLLALVGAQALADQNPASKPAAVQLASAERTLSITDGAVQFLAIGKPSAIKIRGKGTAPKGEVHVSGNTVAGELTFDLNSLDTGIELRDHHMKEKYLETAKSPTASFKISKLTLPTDYADNGISADQLPLEGVLTLHGVSKPVTGKASIKTESGRATAHVEFTAILSDYSIAIPNYLGIKVADQVDVEVNLQSKAADGTKAK